MKTPFRIWTRRQDEVVHLQSEPIGGPDLYSEEYFHEMLVMERKRTERSGQPFVLMLVDIRQLPLSQNILRRLRLALSECTREIDIRGWYERHSIMGIIFIEVTPACETALKAKALSCLRRHFPDELALKIDIRSLPFPDTNEPAGQGNMKEVTRALYAQPSRGKAGASARVIAKRLIDLIGSLSLIILFSPLLLLSAVLIKAGSKGPVFFRQERIGLYGRRFIMLKFRSMYDGSDDQIHQEFMKHFIRENAGDRTPDGAVIYKIQNDSRITPVGRLLRKTSLDELPQLFNVLAGSMSLVGPRPAIPYEVTEYTTWHKRRVLEVKPGITCIWQVEGRSHTDFQTQARMDIAYIKHWSPLLDLKLLLKTPLAVFSSRGAF
jgi:lipopolysaccharide/colanic/teichoic acid biosynthesis glycosyltransferase